MRVLFVAPAYWPATGFGGPIQVMRELARGLVEGGATVDVVTTSLRSVGGPRSWRTRVESHDGASVTYAATPACYRWMGITPSVPIWLERGQRPDIVHVFGFRDPAGTIAAAWCRVRNIPYVFEALGMFAPKLRKVGLKQALDASVFRHVPGGAARALACSRIEAAELLAGGIDSARIVVRPNGFPVVSARPRGALRSSAAIPSEAPLVLSVGRVADGKGLDLLVRAVARADAAHLAIVGPDDGHGTTTALRLLAGELGVTERVHLLGPLQHEQVLGAYTDADVVALASAHESFGMVAAEAAAAGRAILLTDRCGIAELLAPAGALVTPYEGDAVATGLGRLLGDSVLRARLGDGAREVAREWSWSKVVGLQRGIYEELARPGSRAA